MRVEILKTIKEQQLENFGHNGYISDQIYNLTTTIELNFVSFNLTLTNLNEKYIKNYETTLEDIETYNKIITEKNSFGVYDDKELIGIAICEEEKWNNSLYLSNILISEKHRRKGVGKLLIKKITEHAKNKKFRLIELETQNTNVPAIKFYQKHGFKITGLKSNLYNEEIKEKAIYMTLEI